MIYKNKEKKQKMKKVKKEIKLKNKRHTNKKRKGLFELGGGPGAGGLGQEVLYYIRLCYVMI